MQEPETPSKRSIGWMGLSRGHKARPAEWIGEKLIFLVSLSAIVVVFLIFVFVAREAAPVIFGKVTTAASTRVIPAADMDKLTPEALREYLQLTTEEFRDKTPETLKLLMELKEESAKEKSTDKDADVNTASWRHMLAPYQWSDYDKPEYIWQPVSQVKKFNIIPLIIGSLKVTLVALLFAVPISLAAAIYVSQLARPRVREVVKPCIEMLSGIPSVVLGFFGLIVMASLFQNVFHYGSRLNAFVAGIALGLAVIPVVFSIAEDALTSVPRSYVQAALALGSTQWQSAWKVVLPAALPGVFAAVILGFGRAVGETMVVLMVSGNASITSWNVFDSSRTITATIAAELQETVYHSAHYRILFMIGVLLFIITFLSNLAGDLVMHRLKARLEGKR
jgi:phosphate transport system permease protein